MSKLAILRGRPSKLHLGGLFLFDPDSIMKLDGIPIRAQFAHAGYEPTYKSIERAMALNLDHLPKRLGEQMLHMLADAPPSPLQETIRQALAGENDAVLAIQQLGLWRTYREAYAHQLSLIEARLVEYLVHIESQSAPIESLLRAISGRPTRWSARRLWAVCRRSNRLDLKAWCRKHAMGLLLRDPPVRESVLGRPHNWATELLRGKHLGH